MTRKGSGGRTSWPRPPPTRYGRACERACRRAWKNWGSTRSRRNRVPVRTAAAVAGSEVSLIAAEYEALHRQPAAAARPAPVTVLHLTPNRPALHEVLSRPQSILGLPDGTIAHLARQDARRLLPRALRLVHGELRDQYDRNAKRLMEVVRLVENAQSPSTLPDDGLSPRREPAI